MELMINDKKLENKKFYITDDDGVIGFIDLSLLKIKALKYLKWWISLAEEGYNRDKGFVSKRQKFRLNEFRKIALDKLVSLFDKEEYTQEEFNELWNKWVHTSARFLIETMEKEAIEYREKKESGQLDTIARGSAPLAYILDSLSDIAPIAVNYLLRNPILFCLIGFFVFLAVQTFVGEIILGCPLSRCSLKY